MRSSRSATATAAAAMIGLQGGLCVLRLVVLMPLLHALLLAVGVLREELLDRAERVAGIGDARGRNPPGAIGAGLVGDRQLERGAGRFNLDGRQQGRVVGVHASGLHVQLRCAGQYSTSCSSRLWS